MRCVIAGAGISGLALAHELLRRGIEPIVLDSAPVAGGKIRTERHDGFLCEWGPASFLDREPAIGSLVSELRLDARLLEASDAARRRCVLAGGRLLVVPERGADFLRSPVLSGRDKLRVLADLVLPRGPTARGEDESVAAFARRRLGRRAAERLFYPLVSGLYAGDPEHLSLPAMFPWIAALEREHRSVLVSGARALRGASELRLLSFREGMDELTRALAGELGVRLRLETTAVRVDRAGAGFRLVVSAQGREDELHAPAVILAVPSHAAATLVERLAPQAAAAAAAIPWAPVALVYAGYSAAALPHELDSYGFMVAPGEPSRLLGGVFHSAVFAGRARGGHVLVSSRLGGVRDPGLLARSDAELADLAHVELARVLGLGARPSCTCVLRHARALPQYTLGHAARIAAVDAAEAACPGLFFTGNSYRGLGVPDCIRNAATVANRVAEFLGRATPTRAAATGATP